MGEPAVRAALLMVSAALATGVLAAPVAAAPYTVWSCRDAAGAPLPTRAWIPAGNAGTRVDTCSAGGGLQAALGTGDTAPGAISGYRFDVPPGVTITRYTAWLAASTAATALTPGRYVAGLAQGDELTVPSTLDGCYTSAPTCSWGTFSDPLAPANQTVLPVLLGGLGLLAVCADATSVCDPAADPPARATLFRSAVALDDPGAPAVELGGGTLVRAEPVSGTRTVVADAHDDGSGVQRLELLVDGGVVDVQQQPGVCTPPYTVADPCPADVRATFALDTSPLSAGTHRVAVRATDAAGTAATSAEHVFTVAQLAPPPETSPPLPVPAGARVTVPRRVRLPLRGAVTGVIATTGARRDGIRLRFEQRPLDGGDDDWRPLGAAAVTDTAGRFRVPVPSASAAVRVLLGPELAASPAVTEFVRPLKVTISAPPKQLRNGQRLTLRGQVQHAGSAGDGRTILVQSRVGGAWRAVDSVETGRGGRITWRYRFTRTRQPARYRFRFVVPRAKGLPWERTVSRQVALVVRPR